MRLPLLMQARFSLTGAVATSSVVSGAALNSKELLFSTAVLSNDPKPDLTLSQDWVQSVSSSVDPLYRLDALSDETGGGGDGDSERRY